MDENNATFDGAQEGAVDPQTPETGETNPSDGGQPGAVAPEGNNEGGAAPAAGDSGERQPQSRADNQAARLARLAAERQARESIAHARDEAQKAVNAELARMDLRDPETGEPIGDLAGLQALADRVEAQRRNIPPEAFAELREARAEKEALQQQLAGLRAADQERRRADDLAAIRTAFPDNALAKSAKTVQDLGPDFIRAMATQEGMGYAPDPVQVFALVEGLREQQKKAVPPAIGSVSAKSGGSGGEFYSEAELDALTKKDLQDPKIREKAEKSMRRLFGGKPNK